MDRLLRRRRQRDCTGAVGSSRRPVPVGKSEEAGARAGRFS